MIPSPSRRRATQAPFILKLDVPAYMLLRLPPGLPADKASLARCALTNLRRTAHRRKGRHWRKVFLALGGEEIPAGHVIFGRSGSGKSWSAPIGVG